MVAEESGMKISAVGSTIEAENPLPADPAGDSRAQIALAFDSSGNHEIVAEGARRGSPMVCPSLPALWRAAVALLPSAAGRAEGRHTWSQVTS